MKRLQNIIFYTVIIGSFSLLLYFIVKFGKNLETNAPIVARENGLEQLDIFTKTFVLNLTHPLAILLLQIVAIILAARAFSWICKKIKQPAVIGEITAGIVLGPSLLGMYFPEYSNALFPVQSLNNLQLLSQIGLILFMFVVGMELDLKVLKGQAREAIIISHASIIIPFTLGMGLAYFIYLSFSPEGVPFTSFGLFLGISMSITAFPVLARIAQEKGIHKTRLGTVVITCAAIDDITAWSLLAVVIAIVKAGSFLSSFPSILLSVCYVFLMIKLVRPFLKRIGDLHANRENLNKPVVAIFFFVLIISAYTTEIFGIHALFGAFMAGMVMPDNMKFKQLFIEKVEDVAVVLLLPLFFVYTGLRTQIGLLNDPYLWKVCALVILVAITGKFVGSALTAKFVGQSWKDSLTIGALMNTRGLVELVALNIGYDLGVLTPEIFTILVIMALVTTFLTAPSLDLIDRIFKKKAVPDTFEITQLSKYKILICFGNPEMGRILLRLANSLVKNTNGFTDITAMHLFPGKMFNKFKMDDYEKENFAPINTESGKLDRNYTPLFKVSEDLAADIIEETYKGEYDLLLMGMGQSIYEGSTLGKVLGFTNNMLNPDWLLDKFSGKENIFYQFPFDENTRQILLKTKIPVGILINKGIKDIERIMLIVNSTNDIFLVEYARKFINNSHLQVTVLDTEECTRHSPEIKESIRAIEQIAPNHITLLTGAYEDQKIPILNDLILISIDGWKKLEGINKYSCSVLVMKN
jgi:Kef-type K+ transport system membrane component KefB